MKIENVYNNSEHTSGYILVSGCHSIKWSYSLFEDLFKLLGDNEKVFEEIRYALAVDRNYVRCSELIDDVINLLKIEYHKCMSNT